MKYQINTAIAAPARPKQSFEAATEALVASYGRLSMAYDDLIAAEGKVVEAEQVMEDCQLALNTIKKCGVTVESMTILNGENHNLDHALGLEVLDFNAIESLSASTTKLLKAKYVAALEGEDGKPGAIRAAWEKFVQFIRDLWSKLVRWFKELLDSNSKYVRIVSENLNTFSKITGNNDKTINGITAVKAKACIDAAEELLKKVNEYAGVCRRKEINKELFPLPDKGILEKVGITTDQDGKLNTDGMKESLAREKKTIGELGWTSDTSIPKSFIMAATGKDAKAATDSMDRAFRVMVADAEKVRNDAKDDDARKSADQSLEDLSKIRKATLSRATSYMNTYKSLIDAAGLTLLAIIDKVK